MKVAVVTGGRDYEILGDQWGWFLEVLSLNAVEFVAVGDCPTGADKTIRAGLVKYYEGAVFHAAWTLLGLKAGPIRNGRMAAFAASQREHGMVIMFPGGKGTRNCATQCQRVGLEIMMYDKRMTREL